MPWSAAKPSANRIEPRATAVYQSVHVRSKTSTVRYVSVAPKETTWLLVQAHAELAQSYRQVLNAKRDWDVLATITFPEKDVVKVRSVRTVTPLVR